MIGTLLVDLEKIVKRENHNALSKTVSSLKKAYKDLDWKAFKSSSANAEKDIDQLYKRDCNR